MDALASRIERQLKASNYCTVYERELSRVWPMSDKDRERRPQRTIEATTKQPVADILVASHKELEERTRSGLARATTRAAEAAANSAEPLPISTAAHLRDLAQSAARLFSWAVNAQPSVTYYGDDNRTVVVCDPERRKQLIEQRQRLLEQEAKAAPVHKVAAAVPVALPAPAPQPEVNAATGNGVAAQDQKPAPKQDPLSQWMDSVGKAETWKHAGQFGPYPEEYEKW